MGHFINATGTDDTNAFDRNRLSEGLSHGCPGDQPGERYRVAADIQNATATEIAVIVPRVRIEGCCKTKTGFQMAQCSDFSRGNYFQQTGDLRMAAIHEAFHEERAALCGNFCQRQHFSGIHARWLFNQHSFASPHGLDRPFGMPGMWR